MRLPLLSAGWALDQYKRAQAAAEELKEEDRSLVAERSRGAVLSQRDWIAADRAISGLQNRWREVFREWDVVLCPPMPTPAFPHDHVMPYSARNIEIEGKEYPYFDQWVWPEIATTPGLPPTAMPIGLSETGLLIGVQIVAPYLKDRTTLAYAELIEREFGGFIPPQDKLAESYPSIQLSVDNPMFVVGSAINIVSSGCRRCRRSAHNYAGKLQS